MPPRRKSKPTHRQTWIRNQHWALVCRSRYYAASYRRFEQLHAELTPDTMASYNRFCDLFKKTWRVPYLNPAVEHRDAERGFIATNHEDSDTNTLMPRYLIPILPETCGEDVEAAYRDIRARWLKDKSRYRRLRRMCKSRGLGVSVRRDHDHGWPVLELYCTARIGDVRAAFKALPSAKKPVSRLFVGYFDKLKAWDLRHVQKLPLAKIAVKLKIPHDEIGSKRGIVWEGIDVVNEAIKMTEAAARSRAGKYWLEVSPKSLRPR